MKPIVSLPNLNTEYVRRFGKRLVTSVPSRVEGMVVPLIDPVGHSKDLAAQGKTVGDLYKKGKLGSAVATHFKSAFTSPEHAADLLLDAGTAVATRKIPALDRVFRNTSIDEVGLATMAGKTLARPAAPPPPPLGSQIAAAEKRAADYAEQAMVAQQPTVKQLEERDAQLQAAEQRFQKNQRRQNLIAKYPNANNSTSAATGTSYKKSNVIPSQQMAYSQVRRVRPLAEGRNKTTTVQR